MRRTFRKRLTAAALVMTTLLQSGGAAFAGEIVNLMPRTGSSPMGQISEYVYQNRPDEILMSVSLLGAVQRPGIYHVPLKTNVLTLVTIAGGYTQAAETSSLLIRNMENPARLERVDMKKMLHYDPKFAPPAVMPNDLVFIESRQPFFDQDTVTAVGIASSVLGIVLTGLVLSKSL